MESTPLLNISNNKEAEPLIHIILNRSLTFTSFMDYLGEGLIVTVSDSSPVDSVLLPEAELSILLVPMASINVERQQTISASLKEEELEKMQDIHVRIREFQRNQKGVIVVMVSSAFRQDEVTLLTNHLLLKLMPRPPLFLLAHGEAQAASYVHFIAKAMRMESRNVTNIGISEVLANMTGRDYY